MYSDLKNDLSDIVTDSLLPIQKEYEKIINDKIYLNDILKRGAEICSYKARKTLSKVYRKVVLRTTKNSGFVKIFK